jgi:O-methyltransferase
MQKNPEESSQILNIEQVKFPKQSKYIEKLSLLYLKLIDARKEWLAQNMADQSHKENSNDFTYSKLERLFKKLIRKYIAPIPGSPYTKGDIQEIWNVELTPPERLKMFYKQSLSILLAENNSDISFIDNFLVQYNEFGVFNGSSIASFVQAIQELGINEYNVIGYDSFEGLPEGSDDVDGGVWEVGYYTCTMDKTLESLKRKNIPIEKIEFKKGWYDKILTPELANEQIELNKNKQVLPVIMIDCDTYPSSKSVFNYITMLNLNSPFILALDDYRLFNTDLIEAGESQAFIEWAKASRNLKIKRIQSYNRKSEAFVITPK